MSRCRIWPRAAVFDCDGLLVDTAQCWQAAYRRAARDTGVRLDGFDLRTLAGASPRSAAVQLSQALGAKISQQAITDALHEQLTVQPLRPMRGAERLLRALTAGGLPIAIASNAPARAIDLALTRAGLDSFIGARISAETEVADKPHPDVYRRACRELGVDPSDAVALEDSEPGARAARAAALTLITVPISPVTRPYANLAVSRLDDPRVFELFGVAARTYGSGPRSS